MQELYHHIDQGLSAAECTRHPRWHDQLNGVTYFEVRETCLFLVAPHRLNTRQITWIIGSERCPGRRGIQQRHGGVFEVDGIQCDVRGSDGQYIPWYDSLSFCVGLPEADRRITSVVTRAQNGTITAASDPRKAAGRGAAY
jgi:hypothetical protein